MVVMVTANGMSFCALLDVNYHCHANFFGDILNFAIYYNRVQFVTSSIFEQRLVYLWNQRRYPKRSLK